MHFCFFQAELRENFASLTNQLNETNHSWQQYEQTQIDLLKTLLPFSNKTSLEEIIQETILHTNHLTKEIDSLKDINNQYKQLLEEKSLSNAQENQKDGRRIKNDSFVSSYCFKFIQIKQSSKI
jgi:hypothetical protein